MKMAFRIRPGLLSESPILPTPKAILLRWASPIPILVEMNDLTKKYRLKSDDPDFWDVWTGARTEMRIGQTLLMNGRARQGWLFPLPNRIMLLLKIKITLKMTTCHFDFVLSVISQTKLITSH
jgi:hypothetical protein